MITKCSGNYGNSVPELPRVDILPFCILQEEKSDKVLERALKPFCALGADSSEAASPSFP